MTKTTIETITISQIRRLMSEAQLAGDHDQVAHCEAAIYRLENDYSRDHESVLACVSAIRDAEAQSE